MANRDGDIRLPISFKVALLPLGKAAKPGRLSVVNHPANGWKHSLGTSPTQPRKTRPIIAVADRQSLGVPVVLPNGQTIPDDRSPTGILMSPVRDLSPVADEGRRVGLLYLRALYDPETAGGAFGALGISLARDLGYAGRFDYQRSGNFVTGYIHYPQFADVSNFNVGLLCQQAGLTLDETLTIAGHFASMESSNADWADAYGLNPLQRRLWNLASLPEKIVGFHAHRPWDRFRTRSPTAARMARTTKAYDTIISRPSELPWIVGQNCYRLCGRSCRPANGRLLFT